MKFFIHGFERQNLHDILRVVGGENR